MLRRNIDVVVALGLFLVFALNYGEYSVREADGRQYFSFDQRLFGDTTHATGYNFGVGLMNAPFYAVGRLAYAAGFHGHGSTTPMMAVITLASIAWVLLAGVLCAWLLARLGLRHRGLSVAAAIFGSPVWYYASFVPSYSHAADAAAFTLAATAAYQALRTGSGRWAVATGAALALCVAVRPFNIAVAAACVLGLAALRRLRAAATVAAAAAVVFAVAVSIPLALGLSLTDRINGTSVSAGSVGFAPLSPLRMLFTDHRGLFVWTPVTALAAVGVALLFARRHPQRDYLALLTAMTVAIVLMHAAYTFWDGGWSYSARQLAAPLPFFAVGVAGLLASARTRVALRAATAVVVAAACWSVWVGMNHAFGVSARQGAVGVATTRSLAAFRHLAWSYSRARHAIP